MIYEPLLVLGSLKEIVRLVELLAWPFTFRAQAARRDLRLGPEGLAWRAEPSLISFFIYKAVFVEFT